LQCLYGKYHDISLFSICSCLWQKAAAELIRAGHTCVLVKTQQQAAASAAATVTISK
jgi:hypothetical protein